MKLNTSYEVEMPTSQRRFKTLDTINYPVSFDNVGLQCVLAWMTWPGWPSSYASVSAFTWYVNYKQNNGNKKSTSFVGSPTSAGTEFLLRGYTNNFRKNINITKIIYNGQRSYNNTVYERFSNIAFLHKGAHFQSFSDYYPVGYAGLRFDKINACLRIYGAIPAMSYDIFQEFDETSAPTDTNIISSTVAYDLLSTENLVQPPDSDDTGFPLQLDNTGQTLPKDRYDAEYVAWGSKGQTLNGFGHAEKPLSDTSNWYPSTPWTSDDDLAEKNPRILSWLKAVDHELYRASDKRYLMNAHLYFTSTDDIRVSDQNTYTDQYTSSVEFKSLASKWPYAVDTIAGQDVYKYAYGLLLCRPQASGELSFGVTAETDNVYLFLYDRPCNRSTPGIDVDGLSDSMHGNAIPLTKDIKKQISLPVEKDCIYFFRFGTFNGSWQHLVGGAEIRFDDVFNLSVTN